MTDYAFLEDIDSPEALAWAKKWSGESVEKLKVPLRTFWGLVIFGRWEAGGRRKAIYID